MRIDRIETLGFRNLEGTVEFGGGLNILYGDNAQGKSNLLEAIYILGMTKSFRTNQLREAVCFGADTCLVRGWVTRETLTKQLQVVIRESSKELYVNGKRETVTRYLGNLDVFA